MQKESIYLPPLAEVVEVAVEQGFTGTSTGEETPGGIENPATVEEGDDFWG